MPDGHDENAANGVRFVKVEPLDELFQRHATVEIDHIDKTILGHTICTLDGVPATSDKAAADERLPIVLSSSRLALGDLVPKTAWGASLSNMLVKGYWRDIRLPLIEAVNGVCEACGVRRETLNAHEIWNYYLPVGVDGLVAHGHRGIQRLSRIAILCGDCHGMFHLGRAQQVGYLDEVEQRLMAINNWSADDYALYTSTVSARFSEHSKFQWVLDLSILASATDGLSITSRWSADSDLASAVLTEDRPRSGNLSWSSTTSIVGIPWKLSREKEYRQGNSSAPRC